MKNHNTKKQQAPTPDSTQLLEVLKAVGPFFYGGVQLLKMWLDHFGR